MAACEKVLKEAGLKTALHANGTNVEGEWDKVFVVEQPEPYMVIKLVKPAAAG